MPVRLQTVKPIPGMSDDALGQMVDKMIAEGKSDDDIRAALSRASGRPLSTSPLTEFSESTKETVRGLAKGIPGGVVSGVEDIAMLPFAIAQGVIGGIIDAGELASALKSGDYEAVKKMFDPIKNIPAALKQKLNAALDAARNDPEGYGKQVGNFVGEQVPYILATEGAGALPKPAVRILGRQLENIGGGHGAGFALRIAGAHQVMGGNPMGLATMMMPEAMRSGGRAMQRWGTEAGAMEGTFEGKALEIRQRLRQGEDPVVLQKEITGEQQRLVDARKNAKLPQEIKEITAQQRQLDTLSNLVNETHAGAEKEMRGELSAATKELDKEQAAKQKAQEQLDAENEKRQRFVEGKAEIEKRLAGKPESAAVGQRVLSVTDPDTGEKLSAVTRIASGPEAKPKSPFTPDEIRFMKKNGYTDEMIAQLAKGPIHNPAASRPPIRVMGKAATDLAEGRTPEPSKAPPIPERRQDEMLKSKLGGGGQPEAAPTAQAEAENRERNAPYGEGGIIPSAVAGPSERVRGFLGRKAKGGTDPLWQQQIEHLVEPSQSNEAGGLKLSPNDRAEIARAYDESGGDPVKGAKLLQQYREARQQLKIQEHYNKPPEEE